MMELQGEDGSIIELPETKELGRGPGIAPHDRSVSRRQVRLRIAGDLHNFHVGIEVVGPNPICVIHAKPVEVEIVKPGSQSSLRVGDKFSLSIQAPVFYTLAAASTDSGKLVGDDQGVAVDEEEGIAEAVARWQRRKQERLQSDQRFRSSTAKGGSLLPDNGDRIGEQVGVGRTQAEDGSQQQLEREQTERPTTNEDDTDVAQKFGFIAEGSEFERYGKKGLDTSKWDWRIGRQPDDDDDDDEDDGGGRLQQKQKDRIAAGLKTKQKAKLRNEDDDDDDWRGDSEGERELLSARKRPVPRKKDVQTRSHNLATTSDIIVDPGKKRKLVSTSERGSHLSSTSTKKVSKRQSRTSSAEEDDDEGEDLVGFVVNDIEDEDDEVADEEDEWTDEDEDEDEVVEEDDEIDEDPVGAGRPVMDKGDGIDDKPLCKYGNKCFRKNKDHLTQFRH